MNRETDSRDLVVARNCATAASANAFALLVFGLLDLARRALA